MNYEEVYRSEDDNPVSLPETDTQEVERLRNEVQELTDELHTALEEKAELIAQNHILRETASDLYVALGRYIGR